MPTSATMANSDADLPGMLAIAKGVAEQRFPHTMDARVWAAEFIKHHPDADEGDMIGWFANAIMAGYDTAQQRLGRENEQLITKCHVDTFLLERAENTLKPFAECFEKHGKRYWRIGSDWFEKMPDAWPITLEVTMGDCRAALTVLNRPVNSE